MTRSHAVRAFLAALDDARRVQSDDTDDALHATLVALANSEPAPRGDTTHKPYNGLVPLG